MLNPRAIDASSIAAALLCRRIFIGSFVIETDCTARCCQRLACSVAESIKTILTCSGLLLRLSYSSCTGSLICPPMFDNRSIKRYRCIRVSVSLLFIPSSRSVAHCPRSSQGSHGSPVPTDGRGGGAPTPHHVLCPPLQRHAHPGLRCICAAATTVVQPSVNMFVQLPRAGTRKGHRDGGPFLLVSGVSINASVKTSIDQSTNFSDEYYRSRIVGLV